MRRTVLGVATGLAVLTGCSDNVRADPFADYCALAELPASTPAEVQSLQERVGIVVQGHGAKGFVNGARSKRIVLAAFELEQATRAAGAEAAPTGVAPPAVSAAQTSLRTACKP